MAIRLDEDTYVTWLWDLGVNHFLLSIQIPLVDTTYRRLPLETSVKCSNLMSTVHVYFLCPLFLETTYIRAPCAVWLIEFHGSACSVPPNTNIPILDCPSTSLVFTANISRPNPLQPRIVARAAARACLTQPLSTAQTCSAVECWQLQCDVGLLEGGANVILTLRSRLWAETFIEVRRVPPPLHICSTVLFCPLPVRSPNCNYTYTFYTVFLHHWWQPVVKQWK